MLVAAGLALTACGADEPETRPVQLTAPKVTVVEEGDGPAATVRWNDDGAEQDAALVVTQASSSAPTAANPTPSPRTPAWKCR